MEGDKLAGDKLEGDEMTCHPIKQVVGSITSGLAGSEFINDVHDPVESTREKFHNNNLLDDVIYKELTDVQQGVASGMDPNELVRRLGKTCFYI